jgi:hypothetical protein
VVIKLAELKSIHDDPGQRSKSPFQTVAMGSEANISLTHNSHWIPSTKILWAFAGTTASS